MNIIDAIDLVIFQNVQKKILFKWFSVLMQIK